MSDFQEPGTSGLITFFFKRYPQNQDDQLCRIGKVVAVRQGYEGVSDASRDSKEDRDRRCAASGIHVEALVTCLVQFR